jgi:hypothetical protein
VDARGARPAGETNQISPIAQAGGVMQQMPEVSGTPKSGNSGTYLRSAIVQRQLVAKEGVNLRLAWDWWRLRRYGAMDEHG